MNNEKTFNFLAAGKYQKETRQGYQGYQSVN